MNSLQYEYERFVLGKHSKYKDRKSNYKLKEELVIDTKDFKSFINNEKYKKSFRTTLYIFLREALSKRYSTNDGLHIEIKTIENDMAQVTLKYKDYNNYDWKLNPNKVMSNFAKEELNITKVKRGHIQYIIPFKHNKDFIKVLNYNDIVLQKGDFIDFVLDMYEQYKLDLNSLLEIVNNIIYYEYNKRLLVKVTNEEIEILKKFEED